MISEEFYRAVQKAALPGVWSKGVALARSGVVIHDSSGDSPAGGPGDAEIRLRVPIAGRPVSAKVTLWANPDDPDGLDSYDWHCDCGDRNELCMHITAAVVALKNNQAVSGSGNGNDGEGQASAGRVEYRFVKEGRALSLERWIVRGAAREKLQGSLVGYAGGISSGRIAAPVVPATREDFTIDQVINANSNSHSKALSPVSGLFKYLKECPSVFYGDQPIRVSTAALRPSAVIIDENTGFRLKAFRDPEITEAFSNGVVLHQGVFKPWESLDLTSEQKKLLEGDGTFFSRGEVATLVCEVLPTLVGRIFVDIQSKKLPLTEALPPRLELRLEREGPEVLGVTAFMVYGEPVVAEVVGHRLISKGSEILPIRDASAEKSLLRSLQSELNLSLGERIKTEGLLAVQLAQRVHEFSSKQAFARIIGAGAAAFEVSGKLLPRISLSTQGHLIEVDFGGADPSRVFEAWQAGESFVPLLQGGWAPVPKDWLERFGARVLALINSKANAKLPPHRLPELAALLAECGAVVPVSLALLTERLTHFEKIPEAPLPEDLRADLRVYQRQGINWLSFLRETGMGALLADDMGLGKTLQALCIVRGRTLVVAPTSVLRAWEEQAERFRPGLKRSIYYGSARKLDPAADLVITSYGVLRLDHDLLAQEEWDTIILDEAQTIKNPESQAARAAHRLQGRFKLALSGTPVENHLRDLWSQFEFLNPGILGTQKEFQERYASPIEEGRAGAAQSLRQLIKPFLLRRLKREVATELPPRTETVLYCELSENERAVYDSIFASTQSEVLKALGASGAGANTIAVLEALLRLRQAACHPSLVPSQHAETSAKLELFVETLKESIENGHRALVFSQWTSFLDLIQSRLDRENIRLSRLDGSTSAANRADLVGEFQAPSGPDCMLISLKAGGVGLTLTAADHVFILDPWWNPAVEDQAADRAHRIGQENPVLIHRLVARDTVEDRILELQKRKLGIAGAALEGSSQAVSLTREDFLNLLK